MAIEDQPFVYKTRLNKGLYAFYYATEGFATTGILTFLPLYVRNYLSIPEDILGILLAIAAIPAFIKVVYGLVSDSRPIGGMGHRRPYVLMSIPMTIGAWLLFPFVTEAIMFTALVFLAAIGFSMGDTAVDAWAVEITPKSDRGSMMGIAWGAQGIASVMGVLVTTIVGPTFGFTTAFAMLGTIQGVGGLVWFIFAREKPMVDTTTILGTLSVMKEELSHRYLWLAFLAFIFGGFVFGVGSNFMTLFFEDVIGASETEIGLLVLVWSLMFFIGGAIGGSVYDRFEDHRTGVYAIAPIYAISLFMLTLNQPGAYELAYATTIFYGLGSGLTTAAVMGFAARITPAVVAGTVFALITSFVNIGRSGLGNVYLGYMVTNYDYTLAFAIGALIAIPIILLARFIDHPRLHEQSSEESTVEDPTYRDE
jgi:PAT family beta-lactamase induction signal transducer AmpG